jgi:hypothetical protein
MGKRRLTGALLMGVGVSLVLATMNSPLCFLGHALYIIGALVLFSGR